MSGGDSRSWKVRCVPPASGHLLQRTTGAILGVHPCLYEGQWAPTGSGRPAAVFRRHGAECSPDATEPGAPGTPTPHARKGTQSRSACRPREPSCLAIADQSNRSKSLCRGTRRYECRGTISSFSEADIDALEDAAEAAKTTAELIDEVEAIIKQHGQGHSVVQAISLLQRFHAELRSRAEGGDVQAQDMLSGMQRARQNCEGVPNGATPKHSAN